MEKAISLTKNGGFHGFIVPDSFLLGQYFCNVRRYILEHCYIKAIALILEDFWESGNVGRSVVYMLNRQNKEISKSENVMHILMAATLAEFEKGILCEHSYKQKKYEVAHLNRFRLYFNPRDESFVSHVESGLKILAKDVISIHTGVRSKIGQKNIVSSEPKDKTWKKGLTSSACVIRYGVFWDGDYININPDLLWAGGWDPDVVNKDKMLIRQTGDRIIAGIDRAKLYHLNNLHAAVLTDVNIDLRYLLCLFNSKLLFKYYTLISLEFGRAMAQTDIETLEQLPLREVHFMTPEVARKKGLEGLKALYEKGDETGVLVGVEGCLPRDGKGEFLAFKPGATGAEEKSDVVHDFLAFLAERMIALHKERQEKAKQFTGWLREIKGIDTGALKTALKGFWTLDEDGLAQALKAKKVQPSAKDWGEIKAEFAKYKDSLTTLSSKITSTDALIDQIVYLLYGLTKEEINLAQGSAS
jgi:hypothetical protein